MEIETLYESGARVVVVYDVRLLPPEERRRAAKRWLQARRRAAEGAPEKPAERDENLRLF